MSSKHEQPPARRPAISFTATQNSIIAAGITVLCAALVITFVGILFRCCYAMLSAVSVVVTPLVTAFILNLIFKPYYHWLYGRLKRKSFAIIALFASILIPLALLLLFFGSVLASQLVALIEYIPTLAERIYAFINASAPRVEAFITKHGLEEHLETFTDPRAFVTALFGDVSLQAVGGKAISYGMGALRYAVSLFGWFIVPVYLCYFLVAPPVTGTDIVKKLDDFLKPSTCQDVAYLFDEFCAIIVAFFRGQVICAFIQGILFGLGFWIVGLPYGLILGFILGCLNLIPYLGNVIGLAVTLPMAFFGDGGSLLRLGLVGAVFCAVQCIDGYFVTPKIQGQKTGLSDAAIIFSILFWGVVFKGILGMLLAIPLSAFIVVLWPLIKKYIKEFLESAKSRPRD